MVDVQDSCGVILELTCKIKHSAPFAHRLPFARQDCTPRVQLSCHQPLSDHLVVGGCVRIARPVCYQSLLIYSVIAAVYIHCLFLVVGVIFSIHLVVCQLDSCGALRHPLQLQCPRYGAFYGQRSNTPGAISIPAQFML
jgi:hypothetical protein